MATNKWAMVTLLAAASVGANAQTFFVSKGTTLYRATDGGIDQFTLSDELHSLTRDDSGRFVGGSSVVDGRFELYELTDPFGTPTLSEIATTSGRVPTLANISGTLHGVQGVTNLFRFDGAFNETFLGNLGIANGVGGSGYDPVTDKYYLLNHEDDTLYTVDYVNALVTDSRSINLDFEFHGAEWFGGQLWAAVTELTLGQLILGTIDPSTGDFTLDRVIADGFGPNSGTVSLAIIPAPATLSLVALAGLGVTRRRR